MRNYKLLFLTFFIFLFLEKSIFSNDIIAFGTPLIKIESSFESTNRYELNKSESTEFVVAIGFDGKNYLWKTRENKVLK